MYCQYCEVYCKLYHAIENTANQNTGKPLYIRRCSTQPSHRALRSYSRRNLVSVFSMAWYKIVTQHFLVVYCGVSHLSLVFSSYTHSPKGSCVYRENKSKWLVGYSILIYNLRSLSKIHARNWLKSSTWFYFTWRQQTPTVRYWQ